MSIIFSHPTGNANVRAAATALEEAGLLHSFVTSVATFPKSILSAFAGISHFSELSRRQYDGQLKKLTHTWPWREAGRILASKTRINSLIQHESGPFCIDAVYKSIDRRVAAGLSKAVKMGANTVYAYEDGANFSFLEAKKHDLECIYDLPIGYWRTARRLLEKERLLNPEWASTITSFIDSDAKLAMKDHELSLADRIFVASTFTAKTLEDFPGKLAPIEIIPYGFPDVAKERPYSSFLTNRRLKLLFVGGLSQRKGIANLFAAVDGLGDFVSLTIVGNKTGQACEALDRNLAKHHWIPSLPHAEILELMQAHDLLVFPSLFEGFGLVITEAMSQGTPVLTTERTAGPDLIEDGESGWLIEAGSTQAIQEAIEKILNSPQEISRVGRNAKEKAHLRPWSIYGEELVKSILEG